MKNHQKGFVIPLLIAIIAILGIGGGAYIYTHEKSASEAKDKKIVVSTTTIDTNINSNPTTKESLIREASERVLTSLKNKDVETFKTLIHPINGVRFSYDGNVLSTNVKLTPSEITNHIKNNSILLWGYSDGKGSPIEKTFVESFNELYRSDYINAPERSYNKIISGGGSNAINSIDVSYPDKATMSFYFPYKGTYTDKNGNTEPMTIAWNAMDLVFDTYNNKPYLIGIVLDNWTI